MKRILKRERNKKNFFGKYKKKIILNFLNI
jgi:hypothetical protein